jgi:hypothetical protein
MDLDNVTFEGSPIVYWYTENLRQKMVIVNGDMTLEAVLEGHQ